MNTKVLSHYDVMTVGETPCTHSAEEIAAYVLPMNKELNMVFNFELMDIDIGGTHDDSAVPLMYRPWKLADLKRVVDKWQTYMREQGYWNTLYIENHDQARSVSRFGNDSDEWRGLSAKLLAMLQTTQSGTIFVYQGEELGMRNFPRSWGIEEYKDVATINFWEEYVPFIFILSKSVSLTACFRELERRQKQTGAEKPGMDDVLDGFQRKARDHARTPVQWTSAKHAGFTSGTPWMRVNDDYADGWNAEAEMKDPGSVFHFWKRALAMRKEHEVFVSCLAIMIYPENLNVSSLRCMAISSSLFPSTRAYLRIRALLTG